MKFDTAEEETKTSSLMDARCPEDKVKGLHIYEFTIFVNRCSQINLIYLKILLCWVIWNVV